MPELSRCRSCRAELAAAAPVSRGASSKRFECELTGIPARACPKGCPGLYWYWLDFGVEAMELLLPEEADTAALRLGFPWFRQACPRCGVTLADRGGRHLFHRSKKLKNGDELKLKLSAPCLECPNGHGRFMRKALLDHDADSVELGSLVSKAISDGLISE